jgi:2-aminoadipate transaminase
MSVMTQRISTPPRSATAGIHASPRLAEWTRGIGPSIIGEMLSVMGRPGITSFALGLPAPELFPVDAYAEAAVRVLAGDRSALQYTSPYAPLRAQIAEMMAWRGVECRPEQVFLTTAAQQGLSLLAHLFLNPGEQVICERLVYSGFQQAVAPLSPEILPVGTDPETGIDVDEVEALLEGGARPAFIYVITDGQNPLGVNVSLEKRIRLVELAHRFGVPIVEDGAYGLLHYGDAPPPPLRAMDDRWVFYVGSFSKVMAPGFRVGWLIIPETLLPILGNAKDGSDINTSTFSQRVVSAYLETGHFATHLEVVRAAYRERRDVLDAALARSFGESARWTVPMNGALLWLDLGEGMDTTALLRAAVEEESVAYVPGEAFACDGSRAGSSCMRLNFSRPALADIPDGIERLARACARAAERGLEPAAA